MGFKQVGESGLKGGSEKTKFPLFKVCSKVGELVLLLVTSTTSGVSSSLSMTSTISGASGFVITMSMSHVTTFLETLPLDDRDTVYVLLFSRCAF